MRFRIKVRTSDMREWWEDYNMDVKNPQKWAEETIKWFNTTLRPMEKPRTLLAVEVVDESNKGHHRWRKRTDGMSVDFRGETVDLMYCERCGITGKRHGLNKNVEIDSKYRKKAFQKCNTAQQEMRNK